MLSINNECKNEWPLLLVRGRLKNMRRLDQHTGLCMQVYKHFVGVKKHQTWMLINSSINYFSIVVIGQQNGRSAPDLTAAIWCKYMAYWPQEKTLSGTLLVLLEVSSH